MSRLIFHGFLNEDVMNHTMEKKNKNDQKENVKPYRDAPAAYKSVVWRYFGFSKDDEKIAICKACLSEVKYSGGTTNLSTHLKRHHQIDVAAAVPKGTPLQAKPAKSTEPSQATATSPLVDQTPPLQGPFQYCVEKAKLPQHKINRITMSIASYLVTDMRPFVTVQNKAFREMIKTCEPKYTFPSRDTFSETIVPKLYDTTVERLKTELRGSKSVAWTTDAWTSRATESYVTITAHYIKNFQLCSSVLQTRKMDEAHTGSNIALHLTQAAMEWGHFPISLTTDNAANMTVAAREAHISIHVGCIAHTLNLASMKAIDIKGVHHLLARIRPIVGYFHRSVQASNILTAKQAMLKLPKHKLIIDVKTRWNSAYLMVERFLEQQVAVLATLTDERVKKDVKSSIVQSLSNDDIKAAETFLNLMEPMYHATLVFSDNKPTIGMILPMMDKLMDNFSPNDDDNTIVSQIKKSVLDNLKQRYRDTELVQFLEEATALDPRVKHTTTQATWQRLVEKGSNEPIACSLTVKEEPGTSTQEVVPTLPILPQLPQLPQLPELPTSDPEMTDSPPQPLKKKAALSFFFDDEEVEITQVEPAPSLRERFHQEVMAYRVAKRIPSKESPLKFWSDYKDKYPLMSEMACKYLCVQASSVPSERIFSTAGDIVTATRSCLDPESVDQLIFLKKNLSSQDQIRVLERM